MFKEQPMTGLPSNSRDAFAAAGFFIVLGILLFASGR